MATDLFEDENEGKSSEDESKMSTQDAEAEPTLDDDKGWIALDEEELGISPSEAKTEGSSEDEELSYDDIAEGYAEEAEAVEADSLVETEEYIEGNEVEAPPWEEGVEIPAHGGIGSPKRKKVFMIGGVLVLTALVVIGLYVFLKPQGMFLGDKEIKPEGEKPSFTTKKMEKIPIKIAEPEKLPQKGPETGRSAPKANNAPNIKGTPATSVAVGEPYNFIPEGSDTDTDDKLVFFIANQPAWTSFDINSGALTGTPRPSDVGNYENIIIMASDGTATASLPAFNITVTGTVASADTGAAPDMGKEAPHEKMAIEVKKEDFRKEPRKEEAKKEQIGQYTLPDLTDLVRQSEIQDAAREYYNKVKQFPKAYTLKLEVDCIDESVIIAFRQGDFDNRMFILPKDINGKGCFVVCWGLYSTKNEAIKALSSIPTFFSNQASKPQIVIIKQYI